MEENKLHLLHDDGVRKVEVLGDVMSYTIGWANRTEYFSYDDGLYQILTNKSVTPDCRDNRGKIKYKKCSPYLYELACAYYMGYFHTLDDMVGGMDHFFIDKKGKQIDHADSNRHNNTRLNLSMMDSVLNQRKHNIVARFVWPYELTAVYIHPGEYRFKLRYCMELGDDLGIGDVYYRCESQEKFVQGIIDFYKINRVVPGAVLPVANHKEKGKIPHNGSFTDYSIQKQKELAALPVSFFSNAG